MIKLRSILSTILVLGTTLLLSGCKMVILDPKGIIAASEKEVIITAVLLMLTIVIPVILLTWIVAWRYRHSNTKATYKPNWAHSNVIEVICWGIPCVIIAILATITWITSHTLDPYKPLNTTTKPLTVQVIALNWKWLFIYPEQHIATVNYLQLPVNVPVRFLITADAPMNSFQIPQLGSQIYAMPGMQTKLNIMASETGDYAGMSTNFSGNGFSNMKFVTKVSTQQQFYQWVKEAKKSPQTLSLQTYNKLAQPSENDPVQYFLYKNKDDLFNAVMMKFMMPMKNNPA